MGMGFRLQRSHRLEVTGGITESIFPEAEEWLLAEGDHQECLQYVARRKNMDRYTSMMDFLFCEIFVEYRAACFRFYEGNEPRLVETVSQEQINQFDKILLEALKLAYDIFCQERKMSWQAFRHEVLKIAV